MSYYMKPGCVAGENRCGWWASILVSQPPKIRNSCRLICNKKAPRSRGAQHLTSRPCGALVKYQRNRHVSTLAARARQRQSREVLSRMADYTLSMWTLFGACLMPWSHPSLGEAAPRDQNETQLSRHRREISAMRAGRRRRSPSHVTVTNARNTFSRASPKSHRRY